MDCWECDMPFGGMIAREHPVAGKVGLCAYCDRITPEYKGVN